MKIKDGFILKDVAGSKIVIATGEAKLAFNGVITFNSVGAEIFEMLDGKNSPEDIISKISSEYNVDSSIVEKDFNALVEKLRAHKMLED